MVRAVDDPSIEASYTTRDGKAFTYKVTWTHLASGIKWTALVHRDGKEIARPTGVIVFAMDAAFAVKEAVHEFIETMFPGRK